MSRKLTLRLTKSKCTYRSSEPSNSVPYCQASPIRSLDFTKWDSATTAIWRRTVVEEFADTISTSPASKCACQRSPKQTASLFCRPAAAKLARRSISNNRDVHFTVAYVVDDGPRLSRRRFGPWGVLYRREFESRLAPRTRSECKPNPTCSLRSTLVQVVEGVAGRGVEGEVDAPNGAFRPSPCIFVRRNVPPGPLPREPARLRNFRFGLIQFRKSFDFLADVSPTSAPCTPLSTSSLSFSRK